MVQEATCRVHMEKAMGHFLNGAHPHTLPPKRGAMHLRVSESSAFTEGINSAALELPSWKQRLSLYQALNLLNLKFLNFVRCEKQILVLYTISTLWYFVLIEQMD